MTAVPHWSTTTTSRDGKSERTWADFHTICYHDDDDGKLLAVAASTDTMYGVEARPLLPSVVTEKLH